MTPAPALAKPLPVAYRDARDAAQAGRRPAERGHAPALPSRAVRLRIA